MDRCYVCGEKKIKTIKNKPYHYEECGLNVVIFGIPQYACSSCGETFVSIPNIQKLHRLIGANICKNKKALLLPEEVKFLRKDLHLKAKDLAKTLGVTASTVSRWENGKNTIDEAYDRLLRSIYMMYASEQEQHMICGGVINMFKGLPSKRKSIHQKEEIVINPQEWLSSLGELCPV